MNSNALTVSREVLKQRGNVLSVEVSQHGAWRALHNNSSLDLGDIPNSGTLDLLREAADSLAQAHGYKLGQYDKFMRETIDWDGMQPVEATTTYCVRIEVDVKLAPDTPLRDVALAGMRRLLLANPDESFFVTAAEYGSTGEEDFDIRRIEAIAHCK